jgi:uncharacterized repeat protein (TIGR01451 family)
MNKKSHLFQCVIAVLLFLCRYDDGWAETTTQLYLTKYFSPSISADGKHVVFGVLDPVDRNRGQILIRDLSATGAIQPMHIDVDFSEYPSKISISADGRYITYAAYTLRDPNSSPIYLNTCSYKCLDVFLYDIVKKSTTKVSTSYDGGNSNNESYSPAISTDGRYIAFVSDASNLVVEDKNNITDIFVYDRISKQTQRISVASDGSESSGIREGGYSGNYSPSISADGRYIAFSSTASNLVDKDTNTCTSAGNHFNCLDVFMHDRVTRQTIRVSVSSDGSQGEGNSSTPLISADGRYIAFASSAANLEPGYKDRRCTVRNVGSFNCSDIYVHDRVTRLTTRISNTDANQLHINNYLLAMSADGRYIVFHDTKTYGDYPGPDSCALSPSCPHYFIYDREKMQTKPFIINNEGDMEMSISADGRYLLYTLLKYMPLPPASNVYMHDRWLNNSQGAKVSVQQSQPTATIAQGSTFTHKITIGNKGPHVATHLVLTVLLPEGLDLLDTTSPQGRCTGERILICRLQRLVAKAQTEVTLILKAVQAPKKRRPIEASVNAAPSDYDPGNNQSTVIYHVSQ